MTRSKIRHLMMMVSCAAWVSACGDDNGSATGDGTETEGDTEGDDDGPTVTITDPTADTTDDDGETTVDPSDTTPTTADSTTETGPGPCLLPEQIFGDPSFESGTPNEAWGEASEVFGTPLWGSDCASDGSWCSWYGGGPDADVAGVAQTVSIDSADELTLFFDFQMLSSSGLAEDVFYITVDGTELFFADGTEAATYAEYTTIEIDVTDYADGQEHEFEFIGITWGGANYSNFFLDNVRLENCIGGEAVTVTDSVTGIDPTMGPETATDTDGETSGPVEMCDEDLGMTVPLTQDGANSGQGDDSQGSCTDGVGGEDYVYSWTAPADGVYRFDTAGSAANTVLYLYDACMDGTEIACQDDIDLANGDFTSTVTVSLVADQLVAVVVDSYDAASSGAITLNITQVACDAPTDLGNTVPVAEAGNNEGAGDGITPTCATATGGEDVTYTWTAPETALYAFDTAGSTFNTVVAGYIGTCGDPGVQIGCGNDGAMSAFTAAVEADAQVTVVVDGAAAGEEGDFDLAITQVGLLEGDCCATDDSAGCEQGVATNCVCGFIPECCTGEWNEVCVGLAGAQCGAGCAPVDAGTCCDVMDGVGGCDTPAIEACVCGLDDYCCATEWDQLCVGIAVDYCNADCG